jgi:hypothetical protein
MIKVERGLALDSEGSRDYATTITGGVVGVVIDARGRPLTLPQNDKERQERLSAWFKSLDLYPR